MKQTYWQRILEELQSRSELLPGYEWVSALRLFEIGGLNYRRRISDLRLLGHVIENRLEHKGGVTHSYYRLVK